MVRWPKVREVLRHEGAGGLIIRALHKTVGSLLWFERVAFYDMDLAQAPVRLNPPTVELEFAIAMPDDILTRYRACLEADFAMTLQALELCAARGQVAVLGIHDGAVIAMVWLAFDAQEISEIGRTMLLRPGEVLTYNEVTLPAWRGHGIGPCLNQFADAYTRQRGARRRITWRRLGNAASIRVADKLGHRLFSVVTTVRVTGIPHALVFGVKSAELPPLVEES